MLRGLLRQGFSSVASPGGSVPCYAACPFQEGESAPHITMSVVIDVAEEQGGECDVIMLQGDVENLDLISCTFDREAIQLHFENFFLQGHVEEEAHTLIERTGSEGCYVFRRLPVVRRVYRFSAPPRYKFGSKWKVR